MRLPAPSDLAQLRAYVRDERATIVAAARRDDAPVARLWVGRPTVLLKRPQDIAHVLAVHPEDFRKTPRLLDGRAGRISGDGVLAVSDEVAKHRRRPVQSVLRRPRIEAVREVVRRRVEAYADGLAPGQTLEVDGESRALANRVLVDVLYGPDVADEDVVGVDVRRDLFDRAMHGAIPLPRQLPLALRPANRRLLRDYDRLLAEALAAPRGVLLRELVATLGPEIARREVLTVNVTGYRTIAATVATALRLVAGRPDVARRVREEGEPYAGMVIEEALRLEPPTWLIVRMAARDGRLPSGAEVRRGDKVLVCPLVMHHDPALWADPERFDPERFAPEVRPRISRYAYLPFGTGTHGCVGKHFAQLQCALTLQAVLDRFDLRPAADGRVVLQSPEPVPVAA